jgi:hypothetical protein
MRSWIVALVYVPALLGGAVVLWAGLRIATTDLLVGLPLIGVGVVTVILLVRVMLGSRAAPDGTTPTGDITGAYFDYIVWVALGVPMLAVLALAILVITGGASTGR